MHKDNILMRKVMIHGRKVIILIAKETEAKPMVKILMRKVVRVQRENIHIQKVRAIRLMEKILMQKGIRLMLIVIQHIQKDYNRHQELLVLKLLLELEQRVRQVVMLLIYLMKTPLMLWEIIKTSPII